MGIYFPFALIFKDIKQPPSQIFLWAQTLVWDTPLLLWMRILSFFRIRALQPFYSEINEYLIIGSLPLPCDGVVLHELNCGAVVNMCREYEGPTQEYQRYGIVQYRAPTPDLCQPTLEHIIDGCEFMHEFRRLNPSKRIFVHCKGGRARAATMAICFLLREGRTKVAEVEELMTLLTQRRRVISRAIARYPVIQEYAKHVASS